MSGEFNLEPPAAQAIRPDFNCLNRNLRNNAIKGLIAKARRPFDRPPRHGLVLGFFEYPV